MMGEILLGTALRAKREGLGKSQSALAKEWKVGQSVLNRWESSKCIPRKPEYLQKITQFLGLSDGDRKALFRTRQKSKVKVSERNILPLVQRIVHELGDLTVITLSDLQFLAEIEAKVGVPITADYMKKILDRRHNNSQAE